MPSLFYAFRPLSRPCPPPWPRLLPRLLPFATPCPAPAPLPPTVSTSLWAVESLDQWTDSNGGAQSPGAGGAASDPPRALGSFVILGSGHCAQRFARFLITQRRGHTVYVVDDGITSKFLTGDLERPLMGPAAPAPPVASAPAPSSSPRPAASPLPAPSPRPAPAPAPSSLAPAPAPSSLAPAPAPSSLAPAPAPSSLAPAVSTAPTLERSQSDYFHHAVPVLRSPPLSSAPAVSQSSADLTRAPAYQPLSLRYIANAFDAARHVAARRRRHTHAAAPAPAGDDDTTTTTATEPAVETATATATATATPSRVATAVPAAVVPVDWDALKLVDCPTNRLHHIESLVPLAEVSHVFMCWSNMSESTSHAIYLAMQLQAHYPHIHVYVRTFDDEVRVVLESLGATTFSTSLYAFETLQRKVPAASNIYAGPGAGSGAGAGTGSGTGSGAGSGAAGSAGASEAKKTL